jgi:hypothetical protein
MPYFGIYHKELYSVDIICENSTSTMPVSRGEGWVFSCLSSYVLLVHVQGGGSNLSIYHSRLSTLKKYHLNPYIFKALNETKNILTLSRLSDPIY